MRSAAHNRKAASNKSEHAGGGGLLYEVARMGAEETNAIVTGRERGREGKGSCHLVQQNMWQKEGKAANFNAVNLYNSIRDGGKTPNRHRKRARTVREGSDPNHNSKSGR